MASVRRALLPLAAALMLVAALVAPALAQTLNDRVVDQAGVMNAQDFDQAQQGIDRLEDQANAQLWALFVDSTGGQEVTDYADTVAAENSLGGNDALLVVAIDDRRDAIWVGDLLTGASDQELDQILAERVEPQLGDGEWGAAVAGAADGLAVALTDDEPTSPPGPGEGETPPPLGSDGDGPNFFIVLLAIGAIAVGGWILYSRWQAGRAAEEDDRERERRLRGLAQRANTLLIETDELLRHNAQELGFVEAEFGKEAADPFAAALTAARAELQAAFRIRQQLDDGTPEAPPEREQLLNQVVAHCEKAHQLVEEQTKKFQELRDLERRAPQILAEQEGRVAAVEARLPAADDTVKALQQESSGSAQALRGNVAEARKRLELARRAASEGTAALQKGDTGAGARAAKASQDALAQAIALLDAIGREAAALTEAREQLDTAMTAARQDLQAAQSAVNQATDTDQRDELVAAQQKLAAAEQASQGTPRDLVLAYRLAREAESAAEQVVA
ncbi:MAG TPA: TPM domain-containing protein, partial [Candidatus Limnocylindria bacterium]